MIWLPVPLAGATEISKSQHLYCKPYIRLLQVLSWIFKQLGISVNSVGFTGAFRPIDVLDRRGNFKLKVKQTNTQMDIKEIATYAVFTVGIIEVIVAVVRHLWNKV